MGYSPSEMMTVAAARALKNDDVCFVGIGLPSAASNLARLTHAPDITLIYDSGTIAPKPHVLPLSIGDPELCETALATVSVPEMFAYWLQGGRITIGFLGPAQIGGPEGQSTPFCCAMLAIASRSFAHMTERFGVRLECLGPYRSSFALAGSFVFLIL